MFRKIPQTSHFFPFEDGLPTKQVVHIDLSTRQVLQFVTMQT